MRPDLSAPSCFPAHPQKQAPLMQGTEIVSLAFGDQWNSPERERERGLGQWPLQQDREQEGDCE